MRFLTIGIPHSTNGMDSPTREIIPTSDIRELFPACYLREIFPYDKEGVSVEQTPLNGITFSYHYGR